MSTITLKKKKKNKVKFQIVPQPKISQATQGKKKEKKKGITIFRSITTYFDPNNGEPFLNATKERRLIF